MYVSISLFYIAVSNEIRLVSTSKKWPLQQQYINIDLSKYSIHFTCLIEIYSLTYYRKST